MAGDRLAVHLLYEPNQDDLTRLQDQLDPGISLTVGPDIPAGGEIEILVTGRAGRDHLAAYPHLRALIIPWAGVPSAWRDLIPAEFPHLTVHNLHHNAPVVAELTMALLLAATKFIIPFASFIWFSHAENAYMNDQINRIDTVYEHLLNYESIIPVVL